MEQFGVPFAVYVAARSGGGNIFALGEGLGASTARPIFGQLPGDRFTADMVIVLYGSETGNAEEQAKNLVQDIRARLRRYLGILYAAG